MGRNLGIDKKALSSALMHSEATADKYYDVQPTSNPTSLSKAIVIDHFCFIVMSKESYDNSLIIFLIFCSNFRFKTNTIGCPPHVRSYFHTIRKQSAIHSSYINELLLLLPGFKCLLSTSNCVSCLQVICN